MKYTQYFDLAKPDGDDLVDISVLNENADKIDTALHNSGGGGTGVQPDWEQNDDTAADYIKNRICWKEETTVPYFEFETSAYGAEVFPVYGYAPDLSDMLGDTVSVNVIVNTGDEEITFTSECPVINMSEIEPTLSDYYGINISITYESEEIPLGIFISQLDATTVEHSDTDSCFLVTGESFDAKIQIGLPTTTTVYHKIDENYLPTVGEEEYYAEYVVRPTLLVNQPTTTASSTEIWNANVPKNGYVYIIDSNSFVLCQNYSDFINRDGAKSGEIVWTLEGLDTGNEYTLENAMPLMFDNYWDSDISDYVYYFYGYVDNRFATNTFGIAIPTKNTYSSLEVVMTSTADVGYAINYNNQTVSSVALMAPPAVRIYPEYTEDITPTNISVKFPNDRAVGYSNEDEVTFYITCTPSCYIYPPIDISYNNTTVTIAPKQYITGRAVDLHNSYFKYNITSTMNFSSQSLTLVNKLIGAWESDHGYEYRNKYTDEVIDINSYTLGCDALSSVSTKIKEDCTSQEIGLFTFRQEYDDTIRDSTPNKVNSIVFDFDRLAGGYVGYVPLNTKITITGKYEKQ